MIKSKVSPGYNNPFTLAHFTIGYLENEKLRMEKALQYAEEFKQDGTYDTLPEGAKQGIRIAEKTLPLINEAIEHKKSLLAKDPSKLEFYNDRITKNHSEKKSEEDVWEK